MTNRNCKLFFLSLALGISIHGCQSKETAEPDKTPNILFAISDDQSYPHASAYGADFVQTPAFDRIANQGLLFTQAFVAAPQCSPSRAAILTGRNIWQIESAGTHGSWFPHKFPVFTDALENAGYFIGYTGKAWGPGNWQESGWTRNPVGPGYNKYSFTEVPFTGINKNDYARNFEDFLQEKPEQQPFFFWYGGHEPHRVYEYGSGEKAGKSKDNLNIPGFLADHDSIKTDLLDYALEIEWFDAQLEKMLAHLDSIGELDNTIVVVTADNGMAFPFAKANLQEYGTHVPLAISGPGIRNGGRKIDDLVSLIDLAPTFLDLAGVEHFGGISGKSLLNIFRSEEQGYVDGDRQYVLTGRERHTHARPDNLGYPARAIRTKDYLYIKNFAPERWPMGDPPPKEQSPIPEGGDYKSIGWGFEDIDDSPTKEIMIQKKDQWPELFHIGFEKRNTAQLYHIATDPYCLKDLADDPSYSDKLIELDSRLLDLLREQEDPRVMGTGDIFESYPRFGLMRNFPGFKERNQPNPAYLKDTDDQP